MAGDEYGAGTILTIDAVATMVGAPCEAVGQTTAYIGHPAYKEMGGRAFVPTIAALALIEANQLLSGAGAGLQALSTQAAATYRSLLVVGNGFILTALLWGAATASLIDGALVRAAGFFGACAALSLVGIIHSPLDNGALFWPWTLSTTIPYQLAAGYGLVALICLAASRRKPRPP